MRLDFDQVWYVLVSLGDPRAGAGNVRVNLERRRLAEADGWLLRCTSTVTTARPRSASNKSTSEDLGRHTSSSNSEGKAR